MGMEFRILSRIKRRTCRLNTKGMVIHFDKNYANKASDPAYRGRVDPCNRKGAKAADTENTDL